jgi:hypothetical protein
LIGDSDFENRKSSQRRGAASSDQSMLASIAAHTQLIEVLTIDGLMAGKAVSSCLKL